MPQDHSHSRFDSNLWFENQVRRRTRAALRERGSEASTKSAEYRAEYKRQLALFRAERAEIKKRKAEKRAEQMKKKTSQGDGFPRRPSGSSE